MELCHGNFEAFNSRPRTFGHVSDLERHLPADWRRDLFNAVYLKTDGDVVENVENTRREADLVMSATGIGPDDRVSTGFWPGNSRPPGSILPFSRPASHQARSSSSKCPHNMAQRSLRPPQILLALLDPTHLSPKIAARAVWSDDPKRTFASEWQVSVLMPKRKLPRSTMQVNRSSCHFFNLKFMRLGRMTTERMEKCHTLSPKTGMFSLG